jgi:NADH pyrophosphatase NudC (nudix superfamily)
VNAIVGLKLTHPSARGTELFEKIFKNRYLQQMDEAEQRNANKGESCLTPAENVSGEHWRFCPQCGHELINEKCKLRCPRCHYFMSCSDFDFAN